MSKIICITNRKLCTAPFLYQIEKIAASRPDRIILREKDLYEKEYTELAEKIIPLCRKYSVPLTIHFYYKAAVKLGVKRIHMPLHILEEMTDKYKNSFESIGVSCHSIEEANKAVDLGASYITAGHIFETDCKAGLPGRGLDFLKEISSCVSVPVFAIGGISEKNSSKVLKSGADGICIMSGFMKSRDPADLISKLREVNDIRE